MEQSGFELSVPILVFQTTADCSVSRQQADLSVIPKNPLTKAQSLEVSFAHKQPRVPRCRVGRLISTLRLDVVLGILFNWTHRTRFSEISQNQSKSCTLASSLGKNHRMTRRGEQKRYSVRSLFAALIFTACFVAIATAQVNSEDLRMGRFSGGADDTLMALEDSDSANTFTSFGLWFTSGPSFEEIQGSAIAKTGFPKPKLTATNAAGDELEEIAFDHSGDLWLTVCGDGALVEFTPAQLVDLANKMNVEAAAVITNSPDTIGPLDCPYGLQFDSDGDLWVANSGRSFSKPSVVEYTPDQLHTGSPFPAIEINSDQFVSPLDLRFDHSGNLWIADWNAEPAVPVHGAILEFSAAQLSSSGSKIPNLIVKSSDLPNPPPLTLSNPISLQFDSSGDLWAAYSFGYDGTNSGTVVMFSPDQLTGSGTVAPTPQITLGREVVKVKGEKIFSLAAAHGIAFDMSKNLWIGESNVDPFPGAFAKLTPNQLTGAQPSAPSVLLLSNFLRNRRKPPKRINFEAPTSMTFGPPIVTK